MKRSFFGIMSLGVIISAHAQWNTTSTSANIYRSPNVAIGTTTANSTYKLHVQGTLNATGAATLGNTLNVTGATILSNNLTVNGTSTLNTLNVNGTLTANSNANVVGNLSAATQKLGFNTAFATNHIPTAEFRVARPQLLLSALGDPNTGYHNNRVTFGQHVTASNTSQAHFHIGYDALSNQESYVGYFKNAADNGIYLSPNGKIGFNAKLKTDGTSSLNTNTTSFAGDFKFNGTIGSKSLIIGADYVTSLGQTEPVLPASYILSVKGKSEFKDQVVIGNVSSFTQGFPATYKLYVAEGILAEKVKVAVKTTTDWADYVFEESYSLKPLEQVASYVKEHKHLPGVPSANEVVKTGIDMAQMDAKLLEKVEELTLYLIDQNKKLETISQENQALKKRIEYLEKK